MQAADAGHPDRVPNPAAPARLRAGRRADRRARASGPLPRCSRFSMPPSSGLSRTPTPTAWCTSGKCPTRAPEWGSRISNVIDWSAETRLFPRLGYFAAAQAVLSDGGDPEYLRGAYVSRPFADVLGLKPLLGPLVHRGRGSEGRPTGRDDRRGSLAPAIRCRSLAGGQKHPARRRAGHRGRHHAAHVQLPEQFASCGVPPSRPSRNQPHGPQLAGSGAPGSGSLAGDGAARLERPDPAPRGEREAG